jgi:hypothetical protein
MIRRSPLLGCCLSLFFTGQARAALQLDIVTKNAAVRDYITSNLQTDLLKTKPLAESIVGFRLDEAFSTLQVEVRDIRPTKTPNGEQPFYISRIDITVDPNSQRYGVIDFKVAFYHELGHLIFQQYLNRRTNSASRLAELALEFLTVKPGDTKPYGYFADMVRFQSIMTVAKPFHELFADIFELIIIKDGAPLPLRYTWAAVAWGGDVLTDGDSHQRLDPLRYFLWEDWLRPNLSNPRRLQIGAQILLRELADTMDRLLGPCQEDEKCEVNFVYLNWKLTRQVKQALIRGT